MNPKFVWRTEHEKSLVVDYWWDKQNGLCCFCGKKMLYKYRQGPLSRTIEHVIPKRDNGPDTVENVRLAHQSCNSNAGREWLYQKSLKEKQEFFARRQAALDAHIRALPLPMNKDG